jgi:hypothetical protein
MTGYPRDLVGYADQPPDPRWPGGARLARGLGWGQAEDFFVSLRDNFDALHREGEQTPKMMAVALHCRLAGKPARAAAFARFVDHILRHDWVWICRRNDCAPRTSRPKEIRKAEFNRTQNMLELRQARARLRSIRRRDRQATLLIDRLAPVTLTSRHMVAATSFPL